MGIRQWDMKQYDATSLPNPQIKHAKNVEFPLNDKDSYFNLKILRQKEILIACCLFVHILVFLQLCFIILKICANMTHYSGISKYASVENVWGHFPLIKSLHIFWYLAMTVELTGTVEKKNILFYNYSYILYFECLLFSSELSVLITFIIVFSRRIHCCGGGGEGGSLWEAT